MIYCESINSFLMINNFNIQLIIIHVSTTKKIQVSSSGNYERCTKTKDKEYITSL